MESRGRHRAQTERGIIEAVEAYLRTLGYATAGQVRIRTWSPDIVALKGNELVIVEAKGGHGDLRKALAQTALYATDASSAYLALPANRVTGELREAAWVLGIGLMEAGARIKVVVKAPRRPARASLLSRVRRTMAKSPGPPPRRIPPSRVPFDKLLRHRGILDALLAHPGRRFTIRELSATARTPYATTWRVVEALRALGAITSERVGPSEVLSMRGDSPIVADLKQLGALELAPHRRAAREFARRVSQLPGVERVVLFGSVARGTQEPGSDVDIAVVVARKTISLRDRIYDAVSGAQDLTRMHVVPIVLTAHEAGSKGQLGESLRSGEVLFERP